MTMAEIQTKRHPIRGALYGLLLGISGFYFWQFMIDPTFGSLGGVITRAVIALVVGILIGVVAAFVLPARKPKGAAPDAAYTAPDTDYGNPEEPTPAAVETETSESPGLPDEDE
jgi:hypothetical protein